MLFPKKNPPHGFVRSQLVGLLAGIGIASIALFGRNTAFTIMDFIKDLRTDGYATTTAARVTTSEITIDTKMIPLPNAFWQDPTFSVPAPDLFETIENPPADLPVTESTPPPVVLAAPTPEPRPAFDPKHLRQSLHNNLASVFTGDLPYLLLKSGDRLYPGSKLTEGVVLEAISPNGVLCSTPIGILKIEPQPNSPDQTLENENPDKPLPLDPPKPEAESQDPPSHSSPGLVM